MSTAKTKKTYDGIELGTLIQCSECSKVLTELTSNYFGPPDAICEGCCDEGTQRQQSEF